MSEAPASISHRFYKTATGTKLHIAPCPYLYKVDLVEVAEADIGQLCTWCAAEISGHGRTYYDTVDEALLAFQSPADARPMITDALRGVAHDQVWVPNSLSYVALGVEGRMVAWVGKTCLKVIAGDFVELPDYGGGTGGGSLRPERPATICGTCSFALPMTGICDNCG